MKDKIQFHLMAMAIAGFICGWAYIGYTVGKSIGML